ncbi:MAG: hypothetical protein PHQ12_06810 [Chthoniobacteraceae bacterium]|nr:hypothetical protein [Chthoniobacteraceae bacterium]
MQTAAHEQGTKEGKITALRALLAEKFPQSALRAGGVLPAALGTGLPELRRGVVTEVSGSIGSGALFLEALLASAQAEGTLVALVDGQRGFDPAAMGGRLARLLWVLCPDAATAVKAADLLLRDGNLPLVVLDLQLNPARDLRRIPATTWYRFQRILEPSASAFVVLTADPLVSSAAERFALRNRWTLRAMQQRRTELKLVVECAHRRIAGGNASAFAPEERQIA